MPGRVKKAASLTPEEKERRKTLARMRFKAAAKLVIANAYWMEDEGEEFGEDVEKNIQLISKKKIYKSELTMQERSILNTPAKIRTDEEKQIISRAIGGLKCFRRYPSNVKRQLTAVTYFCFYGPGRIIARQNQVAHAMYFLLIGEISVKERRFDKLLNDYVDYEKGPVGHGTMFGEQALLHNLPRPATFTTLTPCELLMIKRDDFDLVLRATVWKSWEAIQVILNSFTYFRNWSEVTKRECSIVAKTRSYAPEETILGDSVGNFDSVYFVTKGSCYMIENMILKIFTEDGKKKKVELYTSDDESQRQASEQQYMTLSQLVQKYAAKSEVATQEPEGENKEASTETETRPSVDHNAEANDNQVSFLKVRSRSRSIPDAPGSDGEFFLKTRFVKVCDFTEGACFNIGENMVRRRIVASVHTNCLIVPRYWILRNNLDEVWTRVKQFLNSHIPTSKDIFKKYLEEQKFIRYRKILVREILQKKKIPNNNSLHNVPYSIRLMEGTDVNYGL